MRGEGEEKKRRRSKREKREWEGRTGVKKRVLKVSVLLWLD